MINKESKWAYLLQMKKNNMRLYKKLGMQKIHLLKDSLLIHLNLIWEDLILLIEL
jgi:hypothetical protein